MDQIFSPKDNGVNMDHRLSPQTSYYSNHDLNQSSLAVATKRGTFLPISGKKETEDSKISWHVS